MNHLLVLETLVINILLGQQTSTQCQKLVPHIYYGDPVSIEDFPFYAGLHNCGSVILSNFWILTAAHCMNNPNSRRFGYVWVGGNYYDNSIRIPYHQVFVHPAFQVQYGVHVNDLALIKLSFPLQYSERVQPVKLPFGDYYQIKNLVVVGRGLDETNRDMSFNELKKVNLIRLSPQECLQLAPPYYSQFDQRIDWLRTIHICTIRAGRIPNVCRGDSGSPLVSGDILIGLLSFGSLQCANGDPTFFTNIHYYLPWIESVTGLIIQ